MTINEYLENVAEEMCHKSAAIRQDFARHRPSAGANREDLVKQFLIGHLPKRFGVSTGLIVSHDDMFSSQADLVVVDDQNNAPLYPESSNKLWPVEAVYALIEVKTHLSPNDLQDAVCKGRKFKRLRREFCDNGSPRRIEDSLFVIWSFESPTPQKLKANLLSAFCNIPRTEQPDLIIVLDRLVVVSGSLLELSALGQRGSQHRRQIESALGSDLSTFIEEPAVYDLGMNALMVWYSRFDSWLRQAGPRLADPIKYLPQNCVFGKKV